MLIQVTSKMCMTHNNAHATLTFGDATVHTKTQTALEL